MTESKTEIPRAYSPSLDNLRNLLIIRSIALLGQTGVLAYVLFASRTTSDLWGVTISLVILAVLTAASLWRTTRPWPVADREFLAQLYLCHRPGIGDAPTHPAAEVAEATGS